MASLFSRKPAAVTEDIDEEIVETPATAARPRAHTPSKKELGLVTPKRKAGGRVAEPPPANRREAVKRNREKERAARAEKRAGMMAGKDEYLPARDRGPERALVRDIVDSRRNLASYFLPVAFAVVIASSGAMPIAVRAFANMFSVAMIVAVIGDSFLLTRRIRRLLATRFPKNTRPPRSHYPYAIMRSLSFRRMRIPGARVKLGDKL